MLMSLFGVFDPVSYWGVGLNWVVVVGCIILFPLRFYCLGGVSGYFVHVCEGVGLVFKEVGDNSSIFMSWLCVLAFLCVGFMNLAGLFPFVFTGTAHPKVTMGVGICFWLCFMLMGWGSAFVNSASHLVPLGSPMGLAPLLVLVESVSHLMRPFTLSIRLAANMMAGHLIVGLLSSVSLMGGFGFFSSFLLQSVLLVLELGVSVIQGFVFSILLMLYVMESY